MATASASITVPTSADQVWNLIGGFDSLPDWLPYIPQSTLSEGGRVRHLANPDGDAIVERLEAFDQAGRSYTYSILRAPFPVTGYRSTLCVVEHGSGSRIDWSGEFTPVGVSDEAASALFEGIYRDGLRALETTLAG
ncbi:SRPBCC family protein [Stenotrophomonas sepilia]